MKKTILLVHPSHSELQRLKVQHLLDEKNRPVRMTHLTSWEMCCNGTGRTIAIYENVFLSPLHGSSDDKVIIFDREGHAFEVSEKDIQQIAIPTEVYAV